MGIFDVLRNLPFSQGTTLEQEVASVTPVTGSFEDYAPQGDNASKEATDKFLAEGA